MVINFNFLDQLTSNEIKKYNGKSVEVQNLINCLINSNNILLFFKFPSSSASNESKLRALLKLKSIYLKKVKKKNYLLALNLIKHGANLKSLGYLDKTFDGNIYLLIFPNIEYLLYFYKNFNSMFFKEKTNFLVLKIANQYFFTDSIEYMMLEKKFSSHELTTLNNFFIFSSIVSSHFLFFIIHFIFQQKFYTLF